MLFGYTNKNAKKSADSQAAVLRTYASNVRIWEEAKGETAEFDFITNCGEDKPDGDVGLAVPDPDETHAVLVDEFHHLATTWVALQERVERIHRFNAFVIEAASGRSTEDRVSFARMLQEAQDFYRSGMTRKERSRIGKLGADASSATKPKPGRMPVSEAIVLLYDVKFTIRGALARINQDTRYVRPWTLSYAYKLAKRGYITLPQRRAGPRVQPAGAVPANP
jgi:hypothetical protein